jgi:hypothetical protein
MSNIQPSSIISRKTEGILASELGNELVMMDTDNGNYIGLNETGKVIWVLLEKPLSVNELVNQLLTRYDIEVDVCMNDTIECLQKLQEQQLIIVD